MSGKYSNGVYVNSFIKQLHGDGVMAAMKGDVFADSCLIQGNTC